MNITFNTPNYNVPVFTARPMNTNIKREDLSKLLNEGKSGTEIAELYNISKGWLSRLIKKFGLDSSKIIKRKRIEASLKKLDDSNITIKEVAKDAKICGPTVSALFKAKNGKTRAQIVKEKFIELLKQNLSDEEIAKQMNVATDTVKNKRYRYMSTVEELKALYHSKKEATSIQIQQMGELIMQKAQTGMSRNEIISDLNISVDEYYKILKTLNIKKDVRMATFNYRNKQKTEFVMQKLNEKGSISEVEKELGVSKATIYHYIKAAEMKDTVHKTNLFAKNEERAERIYNKLLNGQKIEDVAKEENISVSSVRRIVRTYKELRAKD